jgi:Lytic transglycolase
VHLKKVVAVVALIAAVATVAVPGPVGSRVPSPAATVDPGLFQNVEIASLVRGTSMTIPPLDPGARSAGTLDRGSTMVEPDLRTEPLPALVRPTQKPAKAEVIVRNVWHFDGDISWYGPGLYGNGTACGFKMTKGLVGVAHRSLPCGTMVTFRNPSNGKSVTVPVIDRGPYVAGRTWDLSHGACALIKHCYTGTIEWRLAPGG